MIFKLKEYKVIKKLKWGRTNTVLLVENNDWNKYVVKKSENNLLQREIDFYSYVSKNNIKWFPKLIDKNKNWDTLILEFIEWENWQFIDFSWENLEIIWEEFWKILKELHKEGINFNDIEKQKSIDNMINYFNIWENDLVFFKKTFDKEKQKLKKILEENNDCFVMIHWDFSPHNSLFKKDNNWKYHISAILDPSWRAWYWSIFFDIAYLFNTRHVKNKESLKKWFLKRYNINLNSKLFLQFDKVTRMYLIELYNLMWLEKDSKNLYDEFYKN